MKTKQQNTKRFKGSSNYLLSNSSQSNLAIEFYYDQHSGLFLPVANNNQNPQLLPYQPTRKNSHKAKDWFG